MLFNVTADEFIMYSCFDTWFGTYSDHRFSYFVKQGALSQYNPGQKFALID